MRKYLKFSIAFLALASVVACSNRERKVQYMPDMYVSVPYNPNGADGIYKDGVVNSKPVAGTISRGNVPYDYANTDADYNRAKDELKSPLAKDEANLENGKKMYDIYCASCHGKKGDGNGVLSQREKFTGIPNYKDRDITEGSIYHVIMHGKNLMGSHASQLTIKERWQVVQYVEKLRNDLLK
ncbi:c-type cytochrome [Pseudotenacibaculum haliotis]|uniref:C-type cytochrome n=1 Tax=Pseudotenacibaculum haliotis TaxID=1862138 RepID=A0ABW5LTM6_9FLAO